MNFLYDAGQARCGGLVHKILSAVNSLSQTLLLILK